jgi:hypothetical protein
MYEILKELLPTMAVQYLLLIGAIPLARRVSPRRAWAWIVLMLIPFVGTFPFMILIVKALAVILQRIDVLSEK